MADVKVHPVVHNVKVSPAGVQGASGPGVPVGGDAGQVLAKASGANFDTVWTTNSAIVATLEAVGDVDITDPQSGHVLTFDGAAWVNAAPAGGGGASSLDELSDVAIAAAVEGHVLRFDGTDWGNGLVDFGELANIPATFPPEAHGHAAGDIVGLAAVAYSGDYGDLTNIPATFAPAAHTHPLAEITDAGTAAALDAPASGDATAGEVVKGDDTRLSNARDPTAHTHTTAEITDFPSLATVATTGSYDDLVAVPATFPPEAHNHAAGEITSGEFDDARIALSNVTQHEGNLVIDHSQISGEVLPDLGAHFLDVEGAVLAAGAKFLRTVEQAGTVASASLVADQVGDLTVTVRRYTPAGGDLGAATLLGTISIAEGSSERFKRLDDLSGWSNTSLAAGDVVEFEITGTPTNVTWAVPTLGREGA